MSLGQRKGKIALWEDLEKNNQFLTVNLPALLDQNLGHSFHHSKIAHVLHNSEILHQRQERKAAGRINPVELHNFQIKPIISVTYLHTDKEFTTNNAIFLTFCLLRGIVGITHNFCEHLPLFKILANLLLGDKYCHVSYSWGTFFLLFPTSFRTWAVLIISGWTVPNGQHIRHKRAALYFTACWWPQCHEEKQSLITLWPCINVFGKEWRQKMKTLKKDPVPSREHTDLWRAEPAWSCS